MITAGIALALCASSAAAAPPSNNDFENAAPLTSYGYHQTAQGDNTEATAESGEPQIAGSGAGHTIWFSFTATTTGGATVQTGCPPGPTQGVLDVFSAAGPVPPFTNLVKVGTHYDNSCAAPSAGTFNSVVGLSVTAGSTYYVAVDGTGASSQGELQVLFMEGPTPCACLPLPPPRPPVVSLEDPPSWGKGKCSRRGTLKGLRGKAKRRCLKQRKRARQR